MRNQDCAALFRHHIKQVRAIFRPCRRRGAGRARRAIISAYAAVDVVVVVGGEVLRRRSGLQIEHPQIGLGIRSHRLLHCADESDALAIR